MTYDIRLSPTNAQETEIPNQRTFISIDNGTWNGGGGGSITLAPAYRIGRVGYGTASFLPDKIQLYEHGTTAKPIIILYMNSPRLYLHAGGPGRYDGTSEGRLPVGQLIWEVIQIV